MKTGSEAQLVQSLAIAVTQSGSIQKAGQHAAAEASNAESRGLLCAKDQQLDRAPRTNARALQGANRLQPSEHAYSAVVTPCMGNGVDVRSGADCRQGGIAAFPSREGIADRILTHAKVDRQ